MRAGVARLLSFVALFCCCCGTHPRVAPDSEPAPRRVEQQRTGSAAQADLAGTIERIAALRGWAPKLSVRQQVASEGMLLSSMLADARAQMTRSVQEAQGVFLAAFGWVPHGFDAERDLLGRFARDVTGLYSVASGQILLSAQMDSRLARKTLRHELVHAFQDARYGLGERTRWRADRGDYIAAIHSLAEGEATCIELALDDPHHRGCLDASIMESIELPTAHGPDSLPPVIRHSLISPYVDGVHYVQRLLRNGGWPAIEHAWSGGLQTTRQLLHEDEHRALPLPVATPEHEAGECELRYTDLVGEQGLRSLVWDVARGDDLEAVFGALVGERVAVWQCEDTCLAVMRVRFAKASAAHTFGHWLADSAGMNPPGATSCRSVPKHGSGCASAGPRETSCTSLPRRTMSYHEREQDIAVASVLPCHGQGEDKWADRCPVVNRLAARLAEL